MNKAEEFEKLLARDKRYKRGAYVLISKALDYAIEKRLEEARVSGERIAGPAHVSGQDLCLAVKQYALGQFGFMAGMVLGSMGIHKTDDIGTIVFNLIAVGLMNKSSSDTFEDFVDLFDLPQELEEGFAFKN